MTLVASIPTLGDLIGAWIERHCAIPDGPNRGRPYLLTDEMWLFLVNFYAVDPITGRFVYGRGGQLVRPQKWGKSPFAAAVAIAEAAGPTRLSGWDQDGNPLGAPHPTPLVQITSVSEDSAANTWSALLPMLELGDVAHTIEDVGLTRINLPGGGRIEPTTSSARSRHGARLTFSVQDETHLWTETDGGRKLADAQRRNLGGMGGRWLSITNGWDSTEMSVAQYTAEQEVEGGVLHDDVDCGEGDIRDPDFRRRALEKVYGDSKWVDLDRIEEEILALLPRDPAQAERFFLNRKRARTGSAFPGERWDELATEDEPRPTRVKRRNWEGREVFVRTGENEIWTLGVDGAIGGDSRAHDDFGVVACHVASGYLGVVGHWARPENAPAGYRHPEGEIEATVDRFVKEHDVYLVYVDPVHVWNLLARWQQRHGQRQSPGEPATDVFQKFIMRDHNVGVEVARFNEAIISGELRHGGAPLLGQHVKNAMRRTVKNHQGDDGPLWTITKESPDSARKIDLAFAAVLAWAARTVAVANDAKPAVGGRVAAF